MGVGRLHPIVSFGRSLGLLVCLGGTAHAQPPLDRPDFPLPLFETLRADTVLTAVGTVHHVADHVRWTDRTAEMPWCRPGITIGLTARDLDGDGDVDLFFARRRALAERMGGELAHVDPHGDPLPVSHIAWNDADVWSIEPSPMTGSVLTHEWLDLDLDGTLDLIAAHHRLATRLDPPSFELGLWKLQGRRPEPVWTETGVTAFAVGDLDGDGWLEVVHVSPVDADHRRGRLVVRSGPRALTRTVIPVELPEVTQLFSLVVHLLDLDDDGRREIMVLDGAPYWERRSGAVVVRHDGTRWTRIDGPVALGHPVFTAVGAADVDGDGDRDLFLPQSDYFGGRNALLLDRGNGDFDVVTEGTGLFAGYRYTAGMVWADFDHDGRLDGFQPRWAGETRPTRSVLFRQLSPSEGVPRFGTLRGASDPGVGGASAAAVWFDADGDGDLDLLVGRKLDYVPSAPWDSTRDLFFENVSRVGTWLQVDLESERTVVGSRVVVHAGGTRFTRWVGEGGIPGLAGQPLRAHFGLGAARTVDRIDVDWPDGRRESWPSTAVDRVVRLTAGTGTPR